MSDYIGEGFQEGSKLIVVERQAFDHSWTKGVTARHVELRTDDEGKKVWGIEYNVPLRFEAVKGIYKEMLIELATTKGLEVKQDELDASIQKKVRQTWFLGRNGFYIPERILNLKILDLEPQEVLPRHQRNLVGKKNIWHFKNLVESLTAQKKDPKTLESLESLGYTDPEVSRSEALNEVLMDIFRNSKAEFQEFIKTVQASKAPDLLIIHSHGGYGTEIGEQSDEVKETGLNIIGKDSDFQRPGNRIELQEVIDMYQDTTKYAAILVSSCYKGPITNFKSSIKGFMPFGFSGITNYPLQAIFEVVHGRNETLVFGGS